MSAMILVRSVVVTDDGHEDAEDVHTAYYDDVPGHEFGTIIAEVHRELTEPSLELYDSEHAADTMLLREVYVGRPVWYHAVMYANGAIRIFATTRITRVELEGAK